MDDDEGSEMAGAPRARLAIVVSVALALSGTAAVAATPAPSALTAGAATALVTAKKPPRCRVDDVLTRYRRSKDWYRTLVDHELRLPRAFAPKDLVPVSRAGVGGSGKVRKIIVKDLRAMGRAARAAGLSFAVRSAYRSFASQQATFAHWRRQLGYERALLTSARAGHSEHQLGTTVDLRATGQGSSFKAFGATKVGRWVAKNAWKYGFVMSYPQGKTAKTCYKFENWHFRWVGRETARDVRASGLTLREYLWREHHRDWKKR